MEAYDSFRSVNEDLPHWRLVLGRLKAGDMPPKALPQPPEDERQQVIEWIGAVRAAEARRNAGDPGPVLPRRLSNAEYNYTIRDLTGVDLVPTREFPVDPANLAGFDNSGETLTMSPSLLNKYLQAAREVSEHMVLTPDGFDFSPHPMLVETDREKYAVRRIVEFYYSQPTDYADYFEAAWRYKHRQALGEPQATLADVAAEAEVSAKYLPMVWNILEGEADEIGPIAKLRQMWRALPAPGAGAEQRAHEQAEQMRDWIVKLREHTARHFQAPRVEGLSPWSQPLINWRYDEFASHRRDFDRTALRAEGEPEPELPEIPDYPSLGREPWTRARALQLHAPRRQSGSRLSQRAARALRASLCPLRRRLPRRVLHQRARPLLPRRFRRQGPLPQRGLPQRDGLLPRRYAVARADSRRGGPQAFATAVG